ncbi:MAG: hypothetical protein ABIM19_00990 [candidate division WOR-3 bacterium]
MFLIACAIAGASPDEDSLPVYQVQEVIATASLPGIRAESLVVGTEPSATLRQFGLYDYGGMMTPGLSGLPSRHTRVLLAGVPVNSPASGTVDLSLLPMPLIGRGILMLSGSPEIRLWLPDTSEARLFAGSFGLFGGAGFLRMGPALWGLSYRRADNCYPYADEFGREAKRRNSDEKQIGATGAFLLGNLSASLLASATERGSPGPIGSPTPSARLSDTIALISLSYGELGVFGLRDAIAYSDEVRVSRTTAANIGMRFSKWGLSIELARPSALGVVTYSARPKVALIRERWFCQLGGVLWKGPETLNAFPVGEAGLRISWFRAAGFCDAVAPAINDLAWPDDGFAKGNPLLRPEKMWGGELGLESDNLRAWASLKLVDDYIAWVPGDRWSPVNLERVMAPEAGISAREAFFEATVSWNPVRWSARRLAHVPDWKAHARLSWRNLWLCLNYLGPRVTTPGGVRELQGFLLADAGASLTRERFGISLSFLNLSDQTPQQIAGYPIPGRRFVLEITWR